MSQIFFIRLIKTVFVFYLGPFLQFIQIIVLFISDLSAFLTFLNIVHKQSLRTLQLSILFFKSYVVESNRDCHKKLAEFFNCTLREMAFLSRGNDYAYRSVSFCSLLA